MTHCNAGVRANVSYVRAAAPTPGQRRQTIKRNGPTGMDEGGRNRKPTAVDTPGFGPRKSLPRNDVRMYARSLLSFPLFFRRPDARLFFIHLHSEALFRTQTTARSAGGGEGKADRDRKFVGRRNFFRRTVSKRARNERIGRPATSADPMGRARTLFHRAIYLLSRTVE